MNLKRKGEKGRVATGATEFESVSGYHLGPKRKQLEPRNWQLQLLFVLFLKRKFHKMQFKARSKNVFCITEDLPEMFLKTAENSKLQENIC